LASGRSRTPVSGDPKRHFTPASVYSEPRALEGQLGELAMPAVSAAALGEVVLALDYGGHVELASVRPHEP
jgi:hypothetical protein